MPEKKKRAEQKTPSAILFLRTLEELNMAASQEAFERAVQILYFKAEGLHKEKDIMADEGEGTQPREAIVRHPAYDGTYQPKGKGRADPDAQCVMGQLFEDGMGIRIDLKEASRYYHMAADQGHVVCLCMLGYYYDVGELGLKQDQHRAFKLYSFSAEQGNHVAQYNMALMYKVRPCSPSMLRNRLLMPTSSWAKPWQSLICNGQ